MKSVVVEISYAGKNFGAHIPLLPGCVATGVSAKDVKRNIREAIDLHVQGSLEDGDPIPAVFIEPYILAFKFDAESLLNYYRKIFTKPALEEITGINQKLLHHYADGLKKPRPAQRKKIENALHDLGRELLSVELQ